MRRIFSCLALLALLFCLGPRAHAAAGSGFDPESVGKRLTHIYQTVIKNPDHRRFSPRYLQELASETQGYESQAKACVSDSQTLLDRINQGLAAIGAPVPNEPASIESERIHLERLKGQTEGRFALCRLLLLRTQLQSSSLLDMQRNELRAELMRQGPDIISMAQQLPQISSQQWIEARNAVVAGSGISLLTAPVWILLGILVGAAAAAGGFLRRELRERLVRISDQSVLHRLLRAFLASLARYAPALFPILVLSLTVAAITDVDRSQILLGVLVYGLLAYFAAVIVIRTLLWPPAPAAPPLPLPAAFGENAAHQLIVLSLLVPLGCVLALSRLPEDLPASLFLLLWAGFITVLALTLSRLIWIVGRVVGMKWQLRLAASAVILATLIAEYLGYRNLAGYVLIGLVGTTIGSALLFGLHLLFRDLLDGLEEGVVGWQRTLRHRLGLDPGEAFPGLVWLRVLIGVLLWGGFALFLLKVWRTSQSHFHTIYSWITNGVQIGHFTIVPSRLVVGLFLFALLLGVSRWLNNQLDRRLLIHSRLDHGAREAMTKIGGYIGFIVAILVGLSTAGVNFANIAIVAGALSVGIGFGLQNIVNNFVSGLILLFERPIKTGDWIAVGGTEGFVKHISVRSTRIQTFDRADVIVPNSELISQQVTNRTLQDAFGRVTIPVGVAYGSDTELVRDLLLRIANDHPEVVKVGDVPPPQVIFQAFGDSTLNFELRCIIRNIGLILVVRSDLNFAIDKLFRENKIEISFPQRDIWIRGWPELRARATPEARKPPETQGPDAPPA